MALRKETTATWMEHEKDDLDYGTTKAPLLYQERDINKETVAKLKFEVSEVENAEPSDTRIAALLAFIKENEANDALAFAQKAAVYPLRDKKQFCL